MEDRERERHVEDERRFINVLKLQTKHLIFVSLWKLFYICTCVRESEA